ncbi:predicted protein [Lichtheimia corymbifera JMRC:FSU:9682]|uniref:Uncharacterized protein n=1 Tax=Lichtheimia corymbifera JMRC:FSU:9682 TaxID=1263082 RepID=A0A068RXS6_9FUNG|nr:predicted protein [Lichtheimia corymbifera JMRC:FSU:9682]
MAALFDKGKNSGVNMGNLVSLLLNTSLVPHSMTLTTTRLFHTINLFSSANVTAWAYIEHHASQLQHTDLITHALLFSYIITSRGDAWFTWTLEQLSFTI